ncbi:response regulator transcription factor [Rhizobium giardinii]|uniref:response regulator transcription factor n=1 Tax=Rhizobium giardinii TaxID=56731 RepID=UPI003D6EE978
MLMRYAAPTTLCSLRVSITESTTSGERCQYRMQPKSPGTGMPVRRSGYRPERLLLPQKCRNGRSSWCISFADVKFLLPPCPKRPNFDDADLSILQLLREGFSVKEIGIRIELSHRTVEHRIERLKSKMGARSLPHLVALSIAAEL